MIELVKKIDTAIEPLRGIADKIGSPVFDLAARLCLAGAFFSSGKIRFADLINGNFSNQIFLFEAEHPVPGLSPEIAAYASTFGEILLPILVALGLFARFGAAGLLFMTLIIELTYGSFPVHLFWAFLGATILIKGPGKFSVDHLILKYIRA